MATKKTPKRKHTGNKPAKKANKVAKKKRPSVITEKKVRKFKRGGTI
jgi:hypothetical protein